MENYRKILLERTDENVSWDISQFDDFQIKRIGLTFETAPTSENLVSLWQKNLAQSDYDCIIRVESAVGASHVTFENVDGFIPGDFAQLTYTNEDSVFVKGFAVIAL